VARQIERLSSAKVKNAKPGLHPDGGGLYLQVTAGKDGHLNKSWVFRFSVNGRERRMGLGSLQTFGLGEARDRAAECRRRLDAGKDPIEMRDSERAEQQAPVSKSKTFEQCTIDYIATHEKSWRSAKHRRQWFTSLRDFAFPVFGALPVDRVDTALVLQVLTPLWADRIETGTRVRGRIESILDAAKVLNYRDGENPARWKGHLSKLLPSKRDLRKVKPVEHHAAMPYGDLPDFLMRLREQEADAIRALEFLILTAARAGEVLGARWDEIDTKAKVWTIPAERMKAAKEHKVPLSRDAFAIIDSMRGGDPVLVFPGARNGRPLNHMTFARVMQRMGRGDLTVHGFRSTFRVWAAKAMKYPNEVIEMALAHETGSKVELTYKRTDFLEERRPLMEDWAMYCRKPAADNVVPLAPHRR
jgi:integrase